MLTLFDQLQAAGQQAMRLASEARAAAEHKAACQAVTRQRQWAARRAKSAPTLLDTTLALLPATPDAALTWAEIKDRLAGQQRPLTGLASALSRMLKEGRIARIGERRPYRFYNPPKEMA